MCAVKDRVLAARVPFRHSQTWGVQTRSEMLLWLELPLSALRSLCKDLRACGQQLQSKASKGSTIPHRHKLAVLTHTNGSMHTTNSPSRCRTAASTYVETSGVGTLQQLQCQASHSLLLELHRPGHPAIFNFMHSLERCPFRCSGLAGPLSEVPTFCRALGKLESRSTETNKPFARFFLNHNKTCKIKMVMIAQKL